MNILSNCRALIAVLATMQLALTGCASYRISEADIQGYLKDQQQVEHTIGVAGIAQAKVSLSGIQVGIGRVAADRSTCLPWPTQRSCLAGRAKKTCKLT